MSKTTLPLKLPAPDSLYSVLSAHFSVLRDIMACRSYDDTSIMCRACGAEGENAVKGTTDFDKSYGRPRFCSQPCADLHDRWVASMPRPAQPTKGAT